MLLTIKTVDHQVFKIEIDLSQTVKVLKQKLESLIGKQYSAVNQKLVYAGQILEDHIKLSSYDLNEENILVLLVSSGKEKGAKDAQQTEKPLLAMPTSNSSKPSDVKTKTAVSSKTSNKQTASDKPAMKIEKGGQASSLTTNENGRNVQPNEKSVEMLVTLGFDKQTAIQALETSYNDIDTTIELLLASGGKEIEQTQPLTNAEELLENRDQLIATLTSRPEFERLRSMVSDDPQIVVRVSALLCQDNAMLSQAIAQFAAGLLESPSQRTDAPPVSSPRSPSPDVTQMEPGDAAAIQRLSLLGFPLATCYNAYISCDRDQELAANLLLTSPFAEEDEVVEVDAAGLAPSASPDQESDADATD